MVDLGFLLDRHVRKGAPIFRNHRSQLETRPENRLIPTRKETACVRGFELRAEHCFLRARAVLLVTSEKQTAAKFINFAGELEGERVFASGKFGGQSEAK